MEIENHLREKRQALALSQKQLADLAGITRQAVSALESNQYSPATSVALQLARALDCRVEDLFRIKPDGEIIEGELLGALPSRTGPVRAQVTQIGRRLLVRPLEGLGELPNLSASADGLILRLASDPRRVQVRLLKDRDAVERKIVIGGCDPAMFLAAEYLALRSKHHLLPCLMGNGLALAALKRGEVHAAGIHRPDERSGNSEYGELTSSLGGLACIIVTFAHWEEGLIVSQGNRKKIRTIVDLIRPNTRIVNREAGSGARRLLDRELKSAGIPGARVKGYSDVAFSHLDVASRVKAGLADAGIGVRAAAMIRGLDFVPLQRERYDLVIPKAHYKSLSGLALLLDLIVGRTFRDELEALGGYDTRETGKVVDFTHDPGFHS